MSTVKTINKFSNSREAHTISACPPCALDSAQTAGADTRDFWGAVWCQASC